ncbi:hypothetical protein GW17_00032883 [Ensete ventricosum]|nr:hypothetical protein GW17_00032883 [Ensete ventricosum]
MEWASTGKSTKKAWDKSKKNQSTSSTGSSKRVLVLFLSIFNTHHDRRLHTFVISYSEPIALCLKEQLLNRDINDCRPNNISVARTRKGRILKQWNGGCALGEVGAPIGTDVDGRISGVSTMSIPLMTSSRSLSLHEGSKKETVQLSGKGRVSAAKEERAGVEIVIFDFRADLVFRYDKRVQLSNLLEPKAAAEVLEVSWRPVGTSGGATTALGLVGRHRLLPVADHVRGERGLLASHTHPFGTENDAAWSPGADTCCASPSQRAPGWLGRAEPPGLRRVTRRPSAINRPLRRRLIAPYGSVH